jgi:hypothetical protein
LPGAVSRLGRCSAKRILQLLIRSPPGVTSEFSLSDLDPMLKREGQSRSRPEISVMLTRLKRREEIEEIQPAAGPYPAVYQPQSSRCRRRAGRDHHRQPKRAIGERSGTRRPPVRREPLTHETALRTT